MKTLTVMWLLIIGAGFYALQDYGSTPGEVGRPASAWPADSRLTRDPGRANLVLAIHPRCPCSRATIATFADVMARRQDLATVHVLFYKPADCPEGWQRTDLWNSAALIPGARNVCDENGAEAYRFGVMTSGHVMLYSPEGALLFSGGITGSRGHQGSNPGLDGLISCLTMEKTDHTSSPVFGCPLQNREGARR